MAKMKIISGPDCIDNLQKAKKDGQLQIRINKELKQKLDDIAKEEGFKSLSEFVLECVIQYHEGICRLIDNCIYSKKLIILTDISVWKE